MSKKKTVAEKETIEEATRQELADKFEPEVVKYASHYVRKLLAEREYVYARLLNQGGSIILQATAADTERGEQPSGQIGSTVHNELLDLDVAMRDLSPSEKAALIEWGNGLTSKEASQFISARGKIKVTSPEAIRQQRSRAIKKLTDNMNEEGI